MKRQQILAIGMILTGAVLGNSAVAQDNPQPATPQLWQVCNETSYVLRLAIASPVAGKMTPRGWTRIRPGECETPDGTVGIQRFIYAESVAAHRGGIREWKGKTPLCVGEAEFTADATKDCADQGMESRNYIAVSPDDPVTSFVEAREYGGKAADAGIQRLLRDNGYQISRIDGLAGRRTQRTLSSFLKDHELAQNLTRSQQIDALEAAALENVKKIGLTLCNKSDERIWSAIGLRRKGLWESRGWWSIEPEDCLQVHKDSLSTSDLHFYALQEDTPADPENEPPRPDKKLTSVAIEPAIFCIAEARFSALGRENCTDQGYHAAIFRILPTDREGMTVNLTDADFTAASAVILRR